MEHQNDCFHCTNEDTLAEVKVCFEDIDLDGSALPLFIFSIIENRR